MFYIKMKKASEESNFTENIPLTNNFSNEAWKLTNLEIIFK